LQWGVVGRWALAAALAPAYWALLELPATIMLRGVDGLLPGGIHQHPLIGRLAGVATTVCASLLLGIPIALLARRVAPTRAPLWCFVVAAIPAAYQVCYLLCSTCHVWGPYPGTVADYIEMAGTYTGIALGPMLICLLLQRYCPLTTASSAA
jgi:hypothetical protein